MYQDVYSVIDTETTGLFPGKHDRIAELSIVTLSPDGELLERWETLVNPQRDLGKQSLHRISAADVMRAPTFAELADEVAWRISGTVPVAHNLSFDARFLLAEFARTRTAVPAELFDVGLCTMRLAPRYLPGTSRSLAACCDAFDIPLGYAHSAGDDAEAAARLLARYFQLEEDESTWVPHLDAARRLHWFPAGPEARASCCYRSDVTGEVEPHFLERLVGRIADTGTTPQEHDYLALLDRALLDRHLSAHEQQALVELAADLGVTREDGARLHRNYVDGLVDVAWSDGVIEVDERADLHAVAELLAVDPAHVDERLTARPAAAPSAPGASVAAYGPGSAVCLTGDMSVPRNDIAARLEAAGFIIKPGVSKKVDLLVAADPDSLSGKARKARDYGIPVVGEQFVWERLLPAP